MVCDSKTSKGGNNSYGNSEVKEFYKNAEGKKVIPGSSIRGVIANNLAILSYSNISESIKDERFLYRSFGKGKNTEEYVKALGIKTKLKIKKKKIIKINIKAMMKMKKRYHFLLEYKLDLFIKR
ncbi:hypothetical protein F1B95_05325 [Clostridium perfringens]|nr:hypothetical protein F1B95_05325 [Clostridium perfringens]